jgi:hypothetical protein
MQLQLKAKSFGADATGSLELQESYHYELEA